MKPFNAVVVAAAVMAVPAVAPAAPVDGEADLLCATHRTVECGPTGECLEGTADDFNAPVFFRLDFAEGAVHAERSNGSTLDTAIRAKEVGEDRIILQGVENGRGWTAVLDTATGRIVVSAADLGVAFTMFGACTTMK